MNLSNALQTAKNVITANSPQLLVGTAIVGVVTTGILAAKGGYKARGIIDAAQAERDSHETSAPLNFQEKAQLTWLCYAVPALTGASTVAATVGVHTIHTKRHAALAGLYAIGAGKSDELQRKAEELLGAKKSQVLEDHMAQRAVDKDFDEKGEDFLQHEVILTGRGDQLCREDFMGRYFEGNMNVVGEALNVINGALLEGPVKYNDLLDNLGLEPSAAGMEFGWKAGTKVDAKFGGALAPGNKSVINVRFLPAATADYFE